MTDPFGALRQPVEPVHPDPEFTYTLRARMERALLEPFGDAMTSSHTQHSSTTDPAALPWPPALAPYLSVGDARRALDWYVDVFAAERRGEPAVMPDGRIGHAELGIGDAVLMIADDHPELGLTSPLVRGGVSQSVMVNVPDVDATVQRAVALGAELTREVADYPYGRMGIVNDPFGHRWMVTTYPRRATRYRHGDVGHLTVAVPDADRAREFYGAVLGWQFTPGSVEDGWNVENVTPMTGLWGGQDHHEIQPCYRVAHLDAVVALVREHGGQAAEPTFQPYGRLAECVDDQGGRFQLWEPGDG